MIYRLFFLVCLGLALPTFGISLLVFFVVKNKLDSMFANMILNIARSNARTGRKETLYRIRKDGIRRALKAFPINGKSYYSEIGNAQGFVWCSGVVLLPGQSHPILIDITAFHGVFGFFGKSQMIVNSNYFDPATDEKDFLRAFKEMAENAMNEMKNELIN